MSAWNWLGIIAWLLVLAWLIFIILNIRRRHLKMIITEHKRVTGRNVLLDMIEIIIFFGIAVMMIYFTFLRVPNIKSNDEVKLSYTYHPLVLQTNGGQGYFVKVQNGNGKKPIQYYTYWIKGARYSVNSTNASVATGRDPLAVTGEGLPWHKKTLQTVDTQMQHAFVANLRGIYQPNFVNGLGLRVGRHAVNYFLIRVPADTFVQSKD